MISIFTSVFTLVPVSIEARNLASKFLFKEYASYLKGYNTKQSEPIGSKVDRAYGFKQAILDGKIHVHIKNDYLRGEFIKQLKSFPLGKHDDIIDSASYGFNFLKNFGGCVIKTGSIRHRRSLDGNSVPIPRWMKNRNRRRF